MNDSCIRFYSNSWFCDVQCLVLSLVFFWHFWKYKYFQAGGSLGTVFAWDLRWQQQPIILSGAGAGPGAGNTTVQSISESEVWEVQYDSCIKSNTSSTRILPVVICSEDGILAVIEQGMYMFIAMYNILKWQFIK